MGKAEVTKVHSLRVSWYKNHLRKLSEELVDNGMGVMLLLEIVEWVNRRMENEGFQIPLVRDSDKDGKQIPGVGVNYWSLLGAIEEMVDGKIWKRATVDGEDGSFESAYYVAAQEVLLRRKGILLPGGSIPTGIELEMLMEELEKIER